MKQPARAHPTRRLAPPGLARLRARGAALLAAMLTVTLVATFAATALWQQWRSVEVETAERARAQQYPGRLSSFLAAEGNVSQVDDASSETANAFLSGEIIDLQSRMNLRNLLDREDANLPFERLFERLGLPSGTLQQIAMGLRQAQAAGSNEQSTAPLMPRTLVQLGWLGIAPQVIARLEPHVTLLPMRTPINVNTASAEVIWASVDGLDWAKASQFVQSREASPLRNTADALTRMGVASDTPSNNLAVSSSFFEIRGRLRLGDALVSERSLVQRKNMDVVTLWRERGSWTSPSLPLPGQSPAP